MSPRAWVSLGAVAILLAVVVAGAARFVGELGSALTLAGTVLFAVGIAFGVVGLVRRRVAEDLPRELPTGPTESLADVHKALFDAVEAAHPAGVERARMVLTPMDGGRRFEPEIPTLGRTGAPPSVRRAIDRYVAHLVDRGEALETVVVEGEREGGKMRFTITVRHGATGVRR